MQGCIATKEKPMLPSAPDLPPDVASTLQAGVILGRNQSFSLVGGRCSAAQAEALLRLRDSRHYLRVAKSWKDFCPQFLNMSSSKADRIIRWWQEFGPGYFELHNLISIGPDTYRAIEPNIKDGAIHFSGEAITLDPENSQKVLDTIATLRETQTPPAIPKPTLEERLSSLDQRCDAIIAEFEQFAKKPPAGAEKTRFEILLSRASAALQRLEMQMGIF